MAILTIGAISFGLLNGRTWGWTDGRIIASWAVALLPRSGSWSVPPCGCAGNRAAMFRSRVFSAANVAS